MRRRDFLRVNLAAMVAPVAGWLPAATATVNARTFGAAGDGRTDDTAAFGRATRAIARAGGGTIVVDDGTYLIDPDYLRGGSIRLPSDTTLRLSARAVLRAKGGSLTHSSVVHLEHVRNAHVRGGAIEGERGRHEGTGGEWGMGVLLYSAHGCSVRGTRITGCWGDGIYVGSEGPVAGTESTDVVIDGVVCDGNRRQGLSVVSAKRVRITNSAFLNTHGTPPGGGIDFEPDAGSAVVEDCTVRGCRLEGNDVGVVILDRTRRISVTSSTFRGNRQIGLWVRQAIDATVADNIVVQSDAGSTGIRAEPGRGLRLTGNTVRGSYRQAIFAPASGVLGSVISGNHELR